MVHAGRQESMNQLAGSDSQFGRIGIETAWIVLS